MMAGSRKRSALETEEAVTSLFKKLPLLLEYQEDSSLRNRRCFLDPTSDGPLGEKFPQTQLDQQGALTLPSRASCITTETALVLPWFKAHYKNTSLNLFLGSVLLPDKQWCE